jgi:hypothetical protein
MPEDDVDGLEFLRHQLVSKELQQQGMSFSDTSSRLDTQSSVAFDLEQDGTRYWDADDDIQEDPFEKEEEPTPAVIPRTISETSIGSKKSVDAPRASTPPLTKRSADDGSLSASSSVVLKRRPAAQSMRLAQRPVLRSNISQNELNVEDEWDDVDGKIVEQSRRLAEPPLKPVAQVDAPVATATATRAGGAQAQPSKSRSPERRVMVVSETRKLMEGMIEERKKRQTTTTLKLSLGTLAVDSTVNSASPSPRTFALLVNRRAEEPIRTVSCSSSNKTPLRLSLSIVDQFTSLLESVIFLDKSNRITGSSVGTTEGLILRSVGDIEQQKFARCTRILKLCESLHPRGHEPLQVVVEEMEGRVTSFAVEFGAYVIVQVQGKL